MDMKFHFAPVKAKQYTMIWKYTIEQVKDFEREFVHGYFKLSESANTTLDLTNYSRENLKWIRFTAFNAENTMRRAWFSPIRGGAFGEPVQTCKRFIYPYFLKSHFQSFSIETLSKFLLEIP